MALRSVYQPPLFFFEKACTRCGTVKPLNAFGAHAYGKDGLRADCKTCSAQRTRAYYIAHRTEVLAKRKGEQAERVRAYQVAYKAANSVRLRARDRAYQIATAEHRRSYNRQYVQAHRAERAAYARVWHAKHREETRERARARRAANPEKSRAKTAREHQAHPEWGVLAAHRRRIREAGNGGSHTNREWFGLCHFYGGRCLACRQIKQLNRDHIVPVSKGGSNDIGNIQPLCKPCNSAKKNRTIDYRPLWAEFAQ